MPAFVAKPGLPFWNEIAVTDLSRSQHFYKEVFGWEFTNPTEDPGLFFAHKNGLPVVTILQAERTTGVISYFTTDAVDEDAQRAVAAGASLINEPTDFARGRAAIFTDPAGALFGLMQPQGEDFVGAGEPGTPVWYELYSKMDTSSFYGDLLAWRCEQPASGYTVAYYDDAAIAGIITDSHIPGSVWFPYFGVERIDAAMNAATLAGGQVVREPEMTEFGIVASLADPDGTVLIICEVSPWEEEGHEGDNVFDS